MPTVNTSRCGLQNMLTAILSVANAEQDLSYPPFIYESQINTATSLLLSKCVREFLISQTIQDIINPFQKSTKLPIENGVANLPPDYRDMLGNPGTNVRPDGKDCSDPLPVETQEQFKVANLRGGCRTVPIYPVSISEWDELTTSTYAFPTLDNAICCYFESGKLKVCPYDVSKVELRYARKEKMCLATYIMQPDDTFILDPSNPNFQDTEWTDAAFAELFKMMFSLYSAYSRDNDLRDWTQILNKEGII